jgi:hypothetical protein
MNLKHTPALTFSQRPHYAAVLAAEARILRGREVPAHPPLRWNTAYLSALGLCASITPAVPRAKDGEREFAAAVAGLAGVALVALRCVLADEWEFPETDPDRGAARPRLPEAERPGALELIATYDNPACVAGPAHVDEALEECSATWAAWVAQAEVVRALQTGAAEASELWHADRRLQEEDLLDMLDLLGAAAAAATDLLARAVGGSLLFCA